MAKNFIKLFIPLLLGLLLLVWFQKRNVEVSVVRSTIDGRDYVVQNKPDKQEAADMLAQVRARMIKLVNYMKKTNGTASLQGSGKESGPKIDEDDESKYGKYEERTKRLVDRFNPDRISEGNEDVRYTTYTLNKGEKIVFCLRARGEDDRVHDLNMMTFVAIHELGHVASITNHHSLEFKSCFAWLLRNAVACGVYSYEDFNSRPRNYCGIDVTDSPLSN